MQLLVRLGLAALLGSAGIAKLGDPSALADAIANYRFVPEVAVPFLAAVLPATEIVVAAALVAGPCIQGGALVAALMFGVFAVGMAQARLRGIDLDCGCFGAGLESRVTWTKVVMNLLLAAAAGAIAWARPVEWRALLPRDPGHRKQATG